MIAYTYPLYISLVFIILFILRVLTVIYRTLNRHGNRFSAKRLPKDTINTIIVVGSGGHTSEMLYLIEALDATRYSPRLYLIANSDSWSEKKVHECEQKLRLGNTPTNYKVFKIPRSRHVHQSYITSIFTTLYSTILSFPVVFRFNPDLVVCNGPGTCVPICLIAFILRCCFLSKNYIIFIESVCRVHSLSLSGKILQWFADEILVQWPELTSKCVRASYIGRVI